MPSGVQNSWSVTANDNATADSGVAWPEGQAPSTVNNSARAMMAQLAKLVKDWRGGLVTAGTSTAYTLATNETLTLADGVTVTCRMSATNGATPTLNVDSTGAVAIQTIQGTAVAAGDLLSGGIYTFTYYAASAAWVLRQAPGTRGVLNAPATTKMLFFQTSAPTGWTKDTSLDDATIRLVSGSVGSDASSNPAMTTSLAQRTIAQANLPNVNFTVTDPGHTHGHNAVSGTSSTPVEQNPNDVNVGEVNGPGTINPAVTGISVNSGGSGTAMDFRVRYADAIRAEKAA